MSTEMGRNLIMLSMAEKGRNYRTVTAVVSTLHINEAVQTRHSIARLLSSHRVHVRREAPRKPRTHRLAKLRGCTVRKGALQIQPPTRTSKDWCVRCAVRMVFHFSVPQGLFDRIRKTNLIRKRNKTKFCTLHARCTQREAQCLKKQSPYSATPGPSKMRSTALPIIPASSREGYRK